MIRYNNAASKLKPPARTLEWDEVVDSAEIIEISLSVGSRKPQNNNPSFKKGGTHKKKHRSDLSKTLKSILVWIIFETQVYETGILVIEDYHAW